MSVRVYSEIKLHITWHTKNNSPMIAAAIEPRLHQFLKDKVIETSGAYFHAVGGIEDHIHLAVSVKPSIHLDEWVGQLKGASSHEMGKTLQWQAGYGIVSFGTKDRQGVVDYVLNQREHHNRGTTFDRLERIVDPNG
ncbi:MAG: transposase [Pyrinomonadaceae bacterium]